MTSLVWAHTGAPILAAFLASAVEFVEALTVVLAVGAARGWRDALLGVAAAFFTLLLLVMTLGTALTHVPLRACQFAAGALLLLFGLRWLHKAVLRAAGVIPLRDEVAAFARQTHALMRHGAGTGWDLVAFGTAFQITMLEGIEVVFIVVAVSAGGAGLRLPASLGALAALMVVLAAGLALHRPLSRVPENSLKFMVGVLLSAFGTFWFGEAIGIAWPGSDVSVFELVIGYLAVAGLAVMLCRVQGRQSVAEAKA